MYCDSYTWSIGYRVSAGKEKVYFSGIQILSELFTVLNTLPIPMPRFCKNVRNASPTRIILHSSVKKCKLQSVIYINIYYKKDRKYAYDVKLRRFRVMNFAVPYAYHTA
jgi:hypothetical protein